MALIGATSLTFSDWAKRYNDRKVSIIVEMLSQTNEILDDMRWIEGNLPTGHLHTIRTGLPSGTWRMPNYGVPNVKTRTAQVTDSCGMLEAYSEIDKKLADLGGNTSALRLSEDVGIMEGLSQQMATAIFYGDQTVNVEQITGLAPRYSTVVAATAASAQNVIDAGGTGSDNTSIWLVVWGDQSAFGIFPKGTKAGLQMQNLGQHTLFDTNTPIGKYEGYRTHYQWDAGFTVRDWRYIVRIANIDISDLATMTSTGLGTAADLVKYLIQATHKVPNLNGSAAFYMNRTARMWLDLQLSRVQSGIHVTLNEAKTGAMGRMTTHFNGIPLRTVDKITNAEARVV